MRTPPYTPLVLGDLIHTITCPMCEGDGIQCEIVWMPGQEPMEHEVPCYLCHGNRHVVKLMCGRCGEAEHTSPDDVADDVHVCALCGHQAPKLLWLPMQHMSYDPNHDHKKTG